MPLCWPRTWRWRSALAGQSVSSMLHLHVTAALQTSQQLRQRPPAPMAQSKRAGHLSDALGTIRFREIGKQVAFRDFRRALAFETFFFFHGMRYFTAQAVGGIAP